MKVNKIGSIPSLLKNIADGIEKELTEVRTKKATKEIKSNFQDITKSWNGPVIFDIQNSNKVSLIFSNNKVFSVVNHGARPHEIVGNLSFNTGYKPKSLPNPGRAVAGGSATGPKVFTKRVKHPGSEARRFDIEIAKNYQPVFTQLTVDELKKFADKINNS